MLSSQTGKEGKLDAAKVGKKDGSMDVLGNGGTVGSELGIQDGTSVG